MLEQVVEDIGLSVNMNKTEYMCLKQEGGISILNGKLLKLKKNRVFINGRSSHTKSQKMVLDATLLNTQHYGMDQG